MPAKVMAYEIELNGLSPDDFTDLVISSEWRRSLPFDKWWPVYRIVNDAARKVEWDELMARDDLPPPSAACHTHPLGCPDPKPIVCRVCRGTCDSLPCWWAVLSAKVRRWRK